MQIQRAKAMSKQSFYPKDIGPHNIGLISHLGVDHPDGTYYRRGGEWEKRHASRQDTFSLVAVERYDATADFIGYTKQEEYIKINFWLSGRHTTILNGYGQYEHDRPDVFITSGPSDMTKVDVINRNARCVSLSICLLREFFRLHLGVLPDELPEPLRSIVMPPALPYAFHRFALTPDLAATARSVLMAPTAVRRNPLYAQAKAIELTCFVLNLMATQSEAPGNSATARLRHESRLQEARVLVSQRYAESVTLASIAREVGLNRMALTTGFKQLFGLSVYDYLQRERMEHAYELLQDEAYSITQIAEAVGYGYASNFSTAFQNYYGCTPQSARDDRR